jgi:hypothetical protein
MQAMYHMHPPHMVGEVLYPRITFGIEQAFQICLQRRILVPLERYSGVPL